ncbi:MAG: repressor LexA [Nonlabens sp.]|uniref:helix-turn-helix domain-containing protein n=1 Tax=Nonlabens sp. TaxID=1888209 RepID=UPI0039E2EC24
MNRIKNIGIKQTWLVEKLGKGYNMVNFYTQNRTQTSLEVLFKIADVLEIDVKTLINSNTNKE